MTFKQYERELKNPLSVSAECRVFGVLRGGKILNDFFYYPDGKGVYKVPLTECENIKRGYND